MIPKPLRRNFFESLFKDNAQGERLLTEKEFDWVFRSSPCTICSSLYQALLSNLKNPLEVYRMVYARPYLFNRSLGEGVSVFTPGDKPVKQNILTNDILQNRINTLLRDSNKVKYIFSRYAKTNNGIYALMDIKSHNTERLIELHNIISEGLHKVEDTEEYVNSLFLALMNPEDKQNIQGYQSFLDRIEYIKVPYVLDLNTEVEIYRNIFGTHIDASFLPRVLHNFARVIISTRLKSHSTAMTEWIQQPYKYRLYCDDNLMLLKMEIYTGNIPKWLDEEDRKRLNAKRRRRIISESETEGDKGLSGRDSLKIFNDFFSTYARKDKLIDMSVLVKYFTKSTNELGSIVPESILDSLTRMYNYTVLQEVKESLYYYNEEQISKEVQNYLFAVNFKLGSVETCKFTGEKLEITEEFLSGIENRLLGSGSGEDSRLTFRKEVQKEYTVKTLTQEIMVEGRKVTETSLYLSLRERYIHNLKERVLDPFLENENFRTAIKDFGREDFKTYDKRIRDDVTFLITNLCKKYQYTKNGAKEVCMYVIDNDIARQFASS
jgi:predicted Ser/Thr protein kinase